MKKTFGILLVICIFLSILPLYAFAEQIDSITFLDNDWYVEYKDYKVPDGATNIRTGNYTDGRGFIVGYDTEVAGMDMEATVIFYYPVEDNKIVNDNNRAILVSANYLTKENVGYGFYFTYSSQVTLDDDELETFNLMSDKLSKLYGNGEKESTGESTETVWTGKDNSKVKLSVDRDYSDHVFYDNLKIEYEAPDFTELFRERKAIILGQESAEADRKRNSTDGL